MSDSSAATTIILPKDYRISVEMIESILHTLRVYGHVSITSLQNDDYDRQNQFPTLANVLYGR